MNFNTGIGKWGMTMVILIAFVMCLLSLLLHPVSFAHIQYGLSLPSPDSWGFNRVLSWFVNSFLIALIAILLYLINKSFNFIRTTEPTLTAVFLLMACSCPWFTETINTSVLLCLANVVCLGIIFDTYDTRNATQEMFTVGVVVGLGSMVQYAFLPMALVYFLWSLFMKVCRFKETIALLLGVLCPYWIALGTGWLRLSEIKFPSLTPLFAYSSDHSEFILLLSAIAIAAMAGFILTFLNGMKLYAGNAKVNMMNLCVSVLGAVSSLLIIVDFDNMPAYVVTMFMACAVQIANICPLWNPRMPWLVTVLPALPFIAVFVFSMIF